MAGDVMKKSRMRPKKVPYLKRKEPPHNFLGLSPQYTGYKRSKVVVQLLPYEGTVSYTTGTSKGPEAIINASRFLEDFDIRSKKTYRSLGIHTLPLLKPSKKYSAPEPYLKRVFQQSKKLVQDKKFIISLGGEHSLSAAIIPAIQLQHPEITVLHIDAHADLRNQFEGSRYSHACGLRRVQGNLKTVLLGVRTLSQDQWTYIQNKKIKHFFTHDLYEVPPKQWIKEVVKACGKFVYISLDTDAFDPSEMPSTGTPEPGGLHYVDLVELFRQLSLKKTIVGFDLMELAPREDFVAPDVLCARLVHQMVGFVFG